mmetsp:Transcript_49431/g.158146  ORF Transcript_49431/g.158146 Transcript_49431/m.158146 type:complete len:231 (+) Transcript_49431:2107-2799(+)
MLVQAQHGLKTLLLECAGNQDLGLRLLPCRLKEQCQAVHRAQLVGVPGIHHGEGTLQAQLGIPPLPHLVQQDCKAHEDVQCVRMGWCQRCHTTIQSTPEKRCSLLHASRQLECHHEATDGGKRVRMGEPQCRLPPVRGAPEQWLCILPLLHRQLHVCKVIDRGQGVKMKGAPQPLQTRQPSSDNLLASATRLVPIASALLRYACRQDVIHPQVFATQVSAEGLNNAGSVL